MNGIMIGTGLSAMLIAAAGSLVGPPPAAVEEETTITLQEADLAREQAPTTSPGRWEVKLKPVGTLKVVVNGRTRNVFLDDKLVSPERVIWEPDDRVTVFDENRQRQFQVALERNGGVHVRPGNWLEYRAADAPRVAIGIYTEPLLPPLAAQLDLDPNGTLLITAVIENMPAFKSGVRVFDVITGVDEEKKVTQATLEKVVRVKQPGESVRLELIRQTRPLQISVAVQAVTPVSAPELDVLGNPIEPGGNFNIGQLTFENQVEGAPPFIFFGDREGQQVFIEFKDDQALFYPTQKWNNYRATTGMRSLTATTTLSDMRTLEAKIDQLTARILSLEALLRRQLGDDPRLAVPRH